MAESFVFYETFAKQLKLLDKELRYKFYEAIVNYGLYSIKPDFTGLEACAWLPIQEAIDNAKARRAESIENGKKGGRPEIPEGIKEAAYKDILSGMTQEAVAVRYNISQTTVSRIINEAPIPKNDTPEASEETATPEETIQNPENYSEPPADIQKPDQLFKTPNEYSKPPANIQNLNVDVNADVNAKGNSGTIAPQAPPKRRFVKPTVDEVRAYCAERKNNIDPQHFWDYYEARGWKVGGRTAMKDWRAAVRTWEKNNFQTSPPKNGMDGDQSQQSKARALVESWKTGVYV